MPATLLHADGSVGERIGPIVPTLKVVPVGDRVARDPRWSDTSHLRPGDRLNHGTERALKQVSIWVSIILGLYDPPRTIWTGKGQRIE